MEKVCGLSLLLDYLSKVGSMSNGSQHCAVVAGKSNSILACNRKSIDSGQGK